MAADTALGKTATAPPAHLGAPLPSLLCHPTTTQQREQAFAFRPSGISQPRGQENMCQGHIASVLHAIASTFYWDQC